MTRDDPVPSSDDSSRSGLDSTWLAPGRPPPDVEGWEASAAAWLLDGAQPAWRAEPVLTRHPAVLAVFVLGHARAQVAAARAAWHGLLNMVAAGGLPSEAAAGARALLEREVRRLAGHARAVELVAEALRGRRWVPKL